MPLSDPMERIHRQRDSMRAKAAQVAANMAAADHNGNVPAAAPPSPTVDVEAVYAQWEAAGRIAPGEDPEAVRAEIRAAAGIQQQEAPAAPPADRERVPVQQLRSGGPQLAPDELSLPQQIAAAERAGNRSLARHLKLLQLAEIAERQSGRG